MDKEKYFRASGNIQIVVEPNSDGELVIPKNGGAYIIFIDQNRKFAKLKGIFLKRLLTICEGLAN